MEQDNKKKMMEFQVGYRLKDFTNHNIYISEGLAGKRLFRYHYETATIDVDLDSFNDNYKTRFISPDLHRYCVGLLDKLQFEIFSFIQFNKIKSYTVTYNFHYNTVSHSLKVKYGLTQQFV